MHRLNELVEQLTPAQVKEVEDFAEFLIDRKIADATTTSPKFLNVDAVAGMFADLAPDKSDVELADEASEILWQKYKTL